MARTFTIYGSKSELSQSYHPPIELGDSSAYELGLCGLYTYNSVPNIDTNNNKFYFQSDLDIVIDSGNYTIDNFIKEIEKKLSKKRLSFTYNSELKNLELKSEYNIDFSKSSNLSKILGFEEKIYEANKPHIVKLPSESINLKTKESLYVTKFNEINFSVGIYQISDIEKVLKDRLGDNNISLEINKITQKCELFSRINTIDFTKDNTFHKLLGFSKNIYEAGKKHSSDLTVLVLKIVTVRVLCNITTGSYFNGEIGHSIYEFGIDVDPGYAISREPNNIIYYPLISRTISNITIQLIDQEGDLVNFREEPIVVRLELRPIKF